MARLTGITVLATGADTDLGRTTVRRLVAEDASVVAGASVGTSGGELDALADELGPRVTVVPLDVTDADSWAEATARAQGEHGELHGLVNSASSLRTGSITDMDPTVLQSMIDVNLVGPALGILEQPGDRAFKRLDILGRHNDTGVAHYFGQGTAVGGNDRYTAGHGLTGRQPEAFVD